MKAVLARIRYFLRRRNAREGALLCVVLVAVSILVFARPAAAAGGDCSPISGELVNCVRSIIGSILQFFIWAIGSILFLVMRVMLIPIAQYNNFVASPTVELGWAIVRDLTNMFFVVMMLIVAFGTVFGYQEFSYRSILPRLFVMAVLINFSKVIVGLFIDFSQVVMMTFVNGFAAAAGANITNLLGISAIVSLPNTPRIDEWEIVGGMFLAVIMLGLALAAVLTFTVVLTMRIVMLWILTILSPIAFFLSAMPRGRAHEAYSRWWSKLGNYLIVGPVLSFFLWLSFAVAGGGDIAKVEHFPDPNPGGGGPSVIKTSSGGSISDAVNFTSYIVGLALLMGGMMIASEFGVIGGDSFGGAARWVQNKGASFLRSTAFAPLKTGAFLARDIESRVYNRTGVALDPRRYLTGFKKGYESRFAAREAETKESVGASINKGGWRKYTKAFFGDQERFAREYGLIKGVAGLAAAPVGAAMIAPGINRLVPRAWQQRIAPREVESYAKKADEERAKREDIETRRKPFDGIVKEYDAKKARVDAGFSATTTLNADQANELEREAATMRTTAAGMAPGSAARTALEGRATLVDAAVTEARAGGTVDLQGLYENADSNVAAAIRDGMQAGFNALQAEVNDPNTIATYSEAKANQTEAQKQIDRVRKDETFWAGKAMTSRPKGVPTELPKYGVAPELLKTYLEQAIREGDSKGAITALKKASQDKSLGDLMRLYKKANGAGYEGNANGFHDFMEDQVGGRLGWDEQEALQVTDQISADNKGVDPNFSNMTRAGVGGILFRNDPKSQRSASANDLGKGSQEQRIRENKGNLLADTDETGASRPHDMGVAWVARFADILEKRLRDRPDMVSPGIMENLIKHQGAIRGKLEELVRRGSITNEKLANFNNSVQLAAQHIGSVPKKLSDLMSEVETPAPAAPTP